MSVRIESDSLVISPKEIKSVKIIEEPDMLSTQLLDAALDVTLEISSLDDIISLKDSVFTINYQEKLKMKSTLMSYEQKSKNEWVSEMSNYIGVLGKHDFHGDIYVDKIAYELIFEIFAAAGFSSEDIKVDEIFLDEALTLTGYIPYTNCKEALKQVLFAIGATASSYYGVPYIVPVDKQEPIVSIPPARVITGGKVSESDAAEYNKIELTTHTYDKNYTQKTLFNETFRRPFPTAENPQRLLVVFETPVHNLAVQKFPFPSVGASGITDSIIETSANHIVYEWYVSESSNMTSLTLKFVGDGYDHATNVFSNSVESKVEPRVNTIENMTLVNESNAEKIIERCLDYYSKLTTAESKIVVGKHVAEDGTVTYDEDVSCGDMVTIPTDYQGTYTGRVVKEQYNLNGNIIIKEITVK